MARAAVEMNVREARAAIGEAVSARIVELFEADLARMRENGMDEIYARTWRGSDLPGHNPSRVPPVPRALVTTDLAYSVPGVIFTWKSEYQDAPYFRINTPQGWVSRIAHRGLAVIAGSPVTAVLEWDADHHPTRIQTVALYGHFDNSIHGWRAWSSDVVRGVDWTDPAGPRLFAPETTAV
ncbi:hypothetical protein [Streptomyces sp. NRRL S-350]|uniref:hypothetical protein n=1 Tax=Streptomyces sp. NRRL S-350 TaxID=1463902 RepID=UPI0004C13C76|nr:hypothetical protein [Streptomyces sp. NRRL S-350]